MRAGLKRLDENRRMPHLRQCLDHAGRFPATERGIEIQPQNPR